MASVAGKSVLTDGLIVPPTHLELNVVDHCNLTCRSCNHASPVMPAWFADPDAVYRDYAILAKYYRPAFVKVLGGEPLMHKRLAEVIGAARATGISDHFTLITNGSLLDRASDAVWAAVDEVEISVYPGVARVEKNILLARDKARAFGKKLTVFYYDQFRATFSVADHPPEPALVARVYAACKIANLWGCHTVREGYFYKCPQSIYAALLTGRRPEPDGIALVDGPDFQDDLLAYVNSPQPLMACTNCVGTAGVQEPHALLPRKTWREHIERPMAEVIDHDWLARSLLSQDPCDDCKIPARLVEKGRPAWLRRLLGDTVPTVLRLGRRRVRQHADAARADIDAGAAEP